MNKKKLNIILLLFVLGLWGTVIYRYVSQYLYKQEVIHLDSKQFFSFANQLHKKDTFEMTSVKRDPFLNQSFSVTENKTVKNSYKPVRVAKKYFAVKEIYFPIVEYYGYIKSNNEKKKELILIKSNGVLMKLKLEEEREGLKILRIFKDSIQISFNKATRFIKKN